jgi:hypothetical protein
MQKLIAFFSMISLTLLTQAQSTYFQQGTNDNILMDRMEIKLGTNPDLNINTMKPFNRKRMADVVMQFDSLHKNGSMPLSVVDEYNIQNFYRNNIEYAPADADVTSKKPIWKEFYKSKANLLEIKNNDFFFVLNPVIYYNQSKQGDNSQNLFTNTRGIIARGNIGNKISFYTFLTDNQERSPVFIQNYTAAWKAVPGVGFYKNFGPSGGGGVDYWDARGGITFNASKYIDLQFAFDKNFIGNGYRSLLLSDFSNSMLFLKINTRIWKLQYTNLFMELYPQFGRRSEVLLDRKFAAMHTLSFNATKWLSIGLFEGIVYGRRNAIDLSYLNPIIFLRAIEANNGSPDNALVGMNVKANIKKTLQVYGQLMFDEFVLSDLKNNTGNWRNKNGWQLGVKYIDAFGIKNLDLQIEANRMRPFAYTHFDSVSNYTHYNQPLAHPLGANFQEFILLARYQPIPRLLLNARLVSYRQGSEGSNIFEDYRNRTRDEGYFVGGSVATDVVNLNMNASYELYPNIYIDGGAMLRSTKVGGVTQPSDNVFSVGLRMNVMSRQFDF